MSAHTPGPWGAWQPLNNGEWAVTAWEAGDLSARLGDPARLPPRIADEIERGADARLIAAAPDLLAALKWALPFAEKYENTFPGGPRQQLMEAKLAEARAAIAKAEGKS